MYITFFFLLCTPIFSKQHTAVIYLANVERVVDINSSLHSLHTNFLPWTPADVVLFHEIDFNENVQSNLLQQYHDIRFITLPRRAWSYPVHLPFSTSDFFVKEFSMGYRHMCRFFGILIFREAHYLGYRWIIRMDSDSHILSPYKENMISFMVQHGYQYGFRMSQSEEAFVIRGFSELIVTYLRMFDIQPTFLYDLCNPKNLSGVTDQVWLDFTFYNNFFVTDVKFWISPKVEKFLSFIDRSGGIYSHRWGDADMHTATVSMFMNKSSVYQFNEFAYKHGAMVDVGKYCCRLFP